MVPGMSNDIERMVQLSIGDEDLDIGFIQESLSRLPLRDDEATTSSAPPPTALYGSPVKIPGSHFPQRPHSELTGIPGAVGGGIYSSSPSSASYWPDTFSQQPQRANSPRNSALFPASPPNGPGPSPLYAASQQQQQFPPVTGRGQPYQQSQLTREYGNHNGHPHPGHFQQQQHPNQPPAHPQSQLQQQQQHAQSGAPAAPTRPYKSIPPLGYVCKLCKVPGHWIQSCPDASLYPLVRDFSSPNRKITYPPEGYVCRLCNVPGHWIQNCPDAPKYPRPFEQGPLGQGAPQRSGKSGEAGGSSRSQEVGDDEGANQNTFIGNLEGYPTGPNEASGVDDSSTLWMGDLEPWMTEELLTQYFARFGEQAKVRIATFKYGIPAGYCYVYFSSPKVAQHVYESLNGKLMEGSNHVFRLKIANKNSRFFSRSQGNKEPHQSQPPHHQQVPQPQHQPHHFPQARPPPFQKYDLPLPLPTGMIPPQGLSHPPTHGQDQQPPHGYGRMPPPAAAASAGAPQRHFEREYFPEHDPRSQFQLTSDEQSFIDESFEDMSQAFDPGMGDDFSGRSPRSPSYSVFVGNLGQEIDRDTLLGVFQSRYPSVVGGKIVFDPFTGISKGYGFVIFSDELDQLRALKEMQGQLCGDRPMRINKAVRRS